MNQDNKIDLQSRLNILNTKIQNNIEHCKAYDYLCYIGTRPENFIKNDIISPSNWVYGLTSKMMEH